VALYCGALAGLRVMAIIEGLGMIYRGNTGDACPDCQQTITAKDWTCPRCGGILDRYLFSTVTPNSLSGADKDAFRTGYDACMSQWEQTSSTEIGEYRPIPGHETAYRAGWQRASAKLRAKAERKGGRRRGLKVIGSGAFSRRLAPRSRPLRGNHP
jgi:hypothetical protein